MLSPLKGVGDQREASRPTGAYLNPNGISLEDLNASGEEPQSFEGFTIKTFEWRSFMVIS
jgi:hypothetical protein